MSGVETETSAFVFKVAERLPHSDEEGVDGCSISGSATGLFLNFCFSLWICETSGVFFKGMHRLLFFFFLSGDTGLPTAQETLCDRVTDACSFLVSLDGSWFSDGQA